MQHFLQSAEQVASCGHAMSRVCASKVASCGVCGRSLRKTLLELVHNAHIPLLINAAFIDRKNRTTLKERR